MNIELRNHIAQARHPVTNKPLWNDDGTPVPLFPDQRSIWLDGSMIGYVGPPPLCNVLLIVPANKLTRPVVDKITEHVRAELGGDGDTHAVAPRRVPPPDDMDDTTEFDDEDDD